MQIDHDQIFKTLGESFFKEFLELFCREEAALMDFSSVEFLRDEHFTDVPRGRKKQMDLVARVRLKTGGFRCVLVHFEFESRRFQPDFGERLFQYFCQLYLRYGIPVVAVAVFTGKSTARTTIPESFELRLTERCGVRYDYHVVNLSQLDYRNFLESNNPLAYALMAKMNWSRQQIVRLKADFLRLMLGSEINPARRTLLMDFIETYMPLVEHEQSEFLSLVQTTKPYREVEKMVTTYELNGIKKGKEIGRKEGWQEGAVLMVQKNILTCLRKRFGKVPVAIERRIQRCADASKLELIYERVLDCTQLSELDLT